MQCGFSALQCLQLKQRQQQQQWKHAGTRWLKEILVGKNSEFGGNGSFAMFGTFTYADGDGDSIVYMADLYVYHMFEI
jgi:hypothetical protein